jgi:hypothetical protein
MKPPLTPNAAELEVLAAAAANPEGIAALPLVAPDVLHQNAIEKIVKAGHFQLIDMTLVGIPPQREPALAKVFKITMSGRKRLMELRTGGHG